MKDMEALFVCCKQLAARMDGVICLRLSKVPDMGFHSVLTVTSRDVVEASSKSAQLRVGRFAKHLKVSILAHMTIAIYPFLRNDDV